MMTRCLALAFMCLVSLALLSVSGCVAVPVVPGIRSETIPPQMAVVYLNGTLDTCYQRAYTALATTPAQMLASDPTVRHLSGVVHGVVLMNVTIASAPTGCAVTVHGSLLPDKLVQGEFDEVDTFIARLQQGK